MIFDYTFAPAFARNIAYAWSGAKALLKESVDHEASDQVDWFLFKKVLTTCKCIYGGMAVFLLVFLGIIGTEYIQYITRNSEANYVFSWIIYLIAIVLNIYYAYYVSYLRGVGKVDIASRNQVISRIIQILTTIVFLILGLGIVGTCIGYLLYGLIYRLLGKIYFYHISEIREGLNSTNKKIGIKEIKEIFYIVWHNSWKEAIVSISTYAIGQAITVFSSIYLSLAETGIYSLGVQISNALAQMANTLSSAYLPEMQSAYLSKKIDRVREILAEVVVVFVFVYVVGIIAILSVGMPVLHILKPGIAITRVEMFFLLVGHFTLKFPYCYTAYFSATNRICYYKSFLFASLLDILLSYVLLSMFAMGAWGLIFAQIISQIVYNFWIWIKRANKELGLTVSTTISIGGIQVLSVLKQFKKYRH